MIERKYYPLENAAKRLSCKASDIIHLGAVGELPIHALAAGWLIEPMREDGLGFSGQRFRHSGTVRIPANIVAEFEHNSRAVARHVLLPTKDGSKFWGRLLLPDPTFSIDIQRAYYSSFPIKDMKLVVMAEDLKKLQAGQDKREDAMRNPLPAEAAGIDPFFDLMPAENGCEFHTPEFVSAFAENLRRKAGKKDAKPEQSLLLKKLAFRLDVSLPRYLTPDFFRLAEKRLSKAIEICQRKNDVVRLAVLGDVLRGWKTGEIQPIPTGEPKPIIRLGEFLQTLDHFRKPVSRSPYRRLPAREAVFFMLTGKINKLGEPWRKESLEWRKRKGVNPDYPLKLFAAPESEHPERIEAKALHGGDNLPEHLFVRLEEAALMFLVHGSMEGVDTFHTTPFPWINAGGDFVLFWLDEARRYCKERFIPYPAAERMLKDRLKHWSREEMVLWLEHGELIAMDSPYANARKITFRHARWHIEERHSRKGREMPTLANLLKPLYFSKQELTETNPTRWLSYDRLKAWAEESYGWDKEMLQAIIEPFLRCFDDRIRDPTPRTWEKEEGLTDQEKMQGAMYSLEWIRAIEDEYPKPDSQDGSLSGSATTDGDYLLPLLEKEKRSRFSLLECLAAKPKLFMSDIFSILEPDRSGLSEYYDIDCDGIKQKSMPNSTRLNFPCLPAAFIQWCKQEQEERDDYGLMLFTLVGDFALLVRGKSAMYSEGHGQEDKPSELGGTGQGNGEGQPTGGNEPPRKDERQSKIAKNPRPSRQKKEQRKVVQNAFDYWHKNPHLYSDKGDFDTQMSQQTEIWNIGTIQKWRQKLEKGERIYSDDTTS